MKQPFLLKPRGLYWHYRRDDEISFHTTGVRCRDTVSEKPRNKAAATARVLELIASRDIPRGTTREITTGLSLSEREVRARWVEFVGVDD